MPHLESAIHKLQGTAVYATYDMIQCYWQLSYSEESQECQTFVTPDGTWTPRRVLHGNSNAVAHLQSSMDAMLHPMRDRVMAWLDDLLASATNERELLRVHQQFLNSAAPIESCYMQRSASSIVRRSGGVGGLFLLKASSLIHAICKVFWTCRRQPPVTN
jgi:hypothetical protein